MQTICNEISKERYDDYKSRPYGEVNREIEDNLSDAIRWGYGYYGFSLKEENGKYFLCKEIGSSCD